MGLWSSWPCGAVSAKSYLECCVNAESTATFHGNCNKEPILLWQVDSKQDSCWREMGEWEGKLFWGYKDPEGLLFPVKPQTKPKANCVKQSKVHKLAPADLPEVLPWDQKEQDSPQNTFRRASSTLWSWALGAHPRSVNRRHLAGKQKIAGVLQHIWASRRQPESSVSEKRTSTPCCTFPVQVRPVLFWQTRCPEPAALLLSLAGVSSVWGYIYKNF